jgi:hypothetical protein
MGEYEIKGAMRDTAEDVVVTIFAENEEEAARKANASGILITKISDKEMERHHQVEDDMEQLGYRVVKSSTNPTQARSGMTMTDRINRWLAKSVAEINGILFLFICLGAFLYGGSVVMKGHYALGMSIIGGTILLGVMIFGVTAIFCSIHRDVNLLSDNQSSSKKT